MMVKKMPKNDFYDILGVSEKASNQEIKNAYRELAKKYHPDRHKGDKQAEERFKQISEAYSVLSDQKKRNQYDQMRRFGVGGNYSGNSQNFNFEDLGSFFQGGFKGQRGGGFGGFGDIFSQIFGGEQRSGFSQSRQKGQDVTAELTISFDMAITGGKQIFQIGSKKISVNIPAGSEDGKKIRLRGQGQQDSDSRRVYREDDAGPAIFGRYPRGPRGERTGRGPEREPDARHDHAPELFQDVR